MALLLVFRPTGLNMYLSYQLFIHFAIATSLLYGAIARDRFFVFPSIIIYGSNIFIALYDILFVEIRIDPLRIFYLSFIGNYTRMKMTVPVFNSTLLQFSHFGYGSAY